MTNVSKKDKIQHGWNIFVGRMGKLAEQRHMAALRDGFSLLVPLIIAASLGVLCMTFVFGWWDTTQTSILGWISWGVPGQVIQAVNNEGNAIGYKFAEGSVAFLISKTGAAIFYTIWHGIFDHLSLFVVITLGYAAARVNKVKDPFIGSIVSLGAFMILIYSDKGLMGANGMIVAILASLVSMELFAIFERSKKLEIKMPNGVPPAVARAFSKLLPTIFTLMIMVALQVPFIVFEMISKGDVSFGFGLGQSISVAIQAPFISLVSNPNASLTIGIVYTFFTALLWFVGIHGTNVLMGVFSPIAITLLAKNQEYVASGGATGSISTFADGTWDAFMFFGGTGTTLAFVLIALFICKTKATREVLKFGGPSSVFNINEPLLFGVPLILNFSYAVPFIIVQPVLYVITWLCIEKFKIVPPVIVKIPWTSPVIIGGFLAVAHWSGALLAAFNFMVAVLIYLPFVMMANVKAAKAGEELVKIEYKEGFKKIGAKLNSKFNKNEQEIAKAA
ncbi:MAG: PTS sugar transporter subunit IIC [Mycoplasma sp.]